MKRPDSNNSLILAAGGMGFTAMLYAALAFSGQDGYLHSFFYRAWPLQALCSCLFGVAMTFIVTRFRGLNSEADVLRRVQIEPMATISYRSARRLLDNIPAGLKHTGCFRRLSEVLTGYLHTEEILALNEDLSRRDRERIDSGHLILRSLRHIIPIIGFLGTVLGLSLGMMKFPELVSAATSIESMRAILKDFAGSLSMAFDTTVLALSYTILVVLVSGLLTRKEEAIVTEVDRMARELIGKLKFRSETRRTAVAGARSAAFARVLEESGTIRLEEMLGEIRDILARSLQPGDGAGQGG